MSSSIWSFYYTMVIKLIRCKTSANMQLNLWQNLQQNELEIKPVKLDLQLNFKQINTGAKFTHSLYLFSFITIV